MQNHILRSLSERHKFEEIVNNTKEIEKTVGNDPKDWASCIYYKSFALGKLGRFEDQKRVIETSLKQIKPMDNKIPYLILFTAKFYVLWNEMSLDKAISLFSEYELLFDSLVIDVEISHWKATYFHLKGSILWSKGELDESLNSLTMSLGIREKLNNPIDVAATLNNIGTVYQSKGELQEALKNLERSLALKEKYSFDDDVAITLNNVATVYIGLKDHKNALSYLKRSLKVKQKSEIDESYDGSIAKTLNNIGFVYREMGEITKALDYFNRSLKIKKQLNNPIDIGKTLSNIGNIYRDKGELNIALDYLSQSLETLEQVGNVGVTAVPLHVIGKIYHAQGKYKKARDIFKRTLIIYEDMGNLFEIANVTFSLVLVSLDLEQKEQAKEYTLKLKELVSKKPENIILNQKNLAEALIIKQGKRMKDKANAQCLLEDIIKEGTITYELKALAMINLCEILLEELKLYYEEDVLVEAAKIVNELYQLAQDESNISLTIQTLLLRVKFMIITGDLKQALKFLDQATISAEEKGIKLLVNRLEDERKTLEDEYEKWVEIVERNAPVQERLEHSRIVDYLKETSRLFSVSEDPE